MHSKFKLNVLSKCDSYRSKMGGNSFYGVLVASEFVDVVVVNVAVAMEMAMKLAMSENGVTAVVKVTVYKAAAVGKVAE